MSIESKVYGGSNQVSIPTYPFLWSPADGIVYLRYLYEPAATCWDISIIPRPGIVNRANVSDKAWEKRLPTGTVIQLRNIE